MASAPDVSNEQQVDPAAAISPIELSDIKPASNRNSGSARTATSVTSAGTLNDRTRTYIAYSLVGLLAALVFFHFFQSLQLGSICKDSSKIALCNAEIQAFTIAAKESQNIFTAIVGLVGSVIGFYFGQKSNEAPNTS